MPAGGRDLQGTLDMLLPLDIGEVCRIAGRLEVEIILGDLDWFCHQALLQQANTVVQVLCCVDLKVINHSRLFTITRRDDQGAMAPGSRADRYRQRARYPPQMTIQG